MHQIILFLAMSLSEDELVERLQQSIDEYKASSNKEKDFKKIYLDSTLIVLKEQNRGKNIVNASNEQEAMQSFYENHIKKDPIKEN